MFKFWLELEKQDKKVCVCVWWQRGCIVKDKNRKKLSKTKKDTSLYIKRIHQLFRTTKRSLQRYILMKFYRVPRIKDIKNFFKKVFQISERKKIFYVQTIYQIWGLFGDIFRRTKFQKIYSSSTFSLWP